MKVLLAMSGGVDSSVAGVLLRQQGHDVVGVTMKLWGGTSDSGCCSVSDVDDARRVAQQLDIDHLVFNFGDDFDTHVVAPYVAAHATGTTPNPCIECNRHLKFDRLLRRADQLGFDAIATGHHARIVLDASGVRAVERGADHDKDQSYVVHMLGQRALSRTLFPVGEIDKHEVRRIAADHGLRTAAKPDSQDVCFITSTGGRQTFLGERIGMRPARVVDLSGNQVGTVPAVELMTIGQRRGIGVPGGGDKRYVVDVDVTSGVVTIGSDGDLRRGRCRVTGVVWSDRPVVGHVRVQASAHGASVAAELSAPTAEGSVSVHWQSPQRRIAPGQSVVFYDGDDRRVLGGGIAARLEP